MISRNWGIPNAPAKRKSKVLGRYAIRRKAFLTHKFLDAYEEFVRLEQLESHCAAISDEAQNCME